MITGEIAILFASAAGIGAAAATWVYDRRLAKRLTDMKARIEALDDLLADLEQRTRPVFPATTVVESPLVVKVGMSDTYAKVADDIRTDLAKAKALGVAYGVRPVGKSPDLAAPLTKHPLYAKTGLPNQPVASLRPDKPARRCLACGFADRGPDGQPCPNCGD